MPKKLHWKRKVALAKQKAAASLLPPRDPPKRRNRAPKGAAPTRQRSDRNFCPRNVADQIMAETLCKLDNHHDNSDQLEQFCTTDKGRGLRAKGPFAKGTFVIEYQGLWMSRSEAKKKEAEKEKKGQKDVYMFFCSYAGAGFAVDGHSTSNRARLVNHSMAEANLEGRVILDSSGKKRLCFFAKRNIPIGQELLIDYSDRRPSVLQANPWLAK